jgi:hypothetical protein
LDFFMLMFTSDAAGAVARRVAQSLPTHRTLPSRCIVSNETARFQAKQVPMLALAALQ